MKRVRLAAARRLQSGRTLLELMIALTIGLVILAALGVVYLSTTRTNRQSGDVSRMSEDAAIAFNLLGINLRMAGFSQPRALVLPGGAIIDGVKQVAADRHFVGAAVRGCDHGFADVKKGFYDLTCSAGTGPAAIALRFEGDRFNTVPIGTTPSDCVNNAVTTATPSAIDATLTYALIDSRFVGQIGTTSNTPELLCAGSGGTGTAIFNAEPLTQFVDNVQFSYGVAADRESRDVIQYMSASQVDTLPTSAANPVQMVDGRWSRVVNIKACIVMRSENRNQADTGTYIDCDGNPAASADGYARRAFNSVYALRNRSGFLTP